ncbi:MAG: hypothetical protein R3E82_05240 [Pseudomonadales bacterium]|nr:hypothetical protein [Pseudomonadales bacterium]
MSGVTNDLDTCALTPSGSAVNTGVAALGKNHATQVHAAKVFVPFSEALVARHGASLGDLVPFRSHYTCLRLAEPAGQYGWSDVEIEQPA